MSKFRKVTGKIIHTRKVKKKPNNKVNLNYKEDEIKNLLECLERNELVPIKNFLRSLISKKPVKIKQYVEIAEEFRVANIRKQTPAERAFKKMLKEIKAKFVFQKEIFYSPGKFYIMDFWIPTKRLCIEIDGGYHGTEEQILKDAERTRIISSKGIKVIRFTNDEVFKDKFLKEKVTLLLN